jgi:hypothetical protein
MWDEVTDSHRYPGCAAREAFRSPTDGEIIQQPSFSGGSTNAILTSWLAQLEEKQQQLKAGQRPPLPHACSVIIMCGMACL